MKNTGGDLAKTDISLNELQAYVWQMNKDREFNLDDPSRKMMMLIEEVGELAKSLRKTVGLKLDASTERTNLEEELADVQIVLLGLASMMRVNMRDAVVAKEAKNDKRRWTS